VPPPRITMRCAMSAANAGLTALVRTEGHLQAGLRSRTFVYGSLGSSKVIYENDKGKGVSAPFPSSTYSALGDLLAVRAQGLAAGPMGGFDAEALDADFFPDGRWRSILVVNIGHPGENPGSTGCQASTRPTSSAGPDHGGPACHSSHMRAVSSQIHGLCADDHASVRSGRRGSCGIMPS
jgi:hypothetical protein